jgi:hypothetical protein
LEARCGDLSCQLCEEIRALRDNTALEQVALNNEDSNCCEDLGRSR